MTISRPFDLTLPLMNAAGSLGFTPNTYDERVDMTRFGAFITNPITYTAHTPARKRSLIPYPGGFFLHSGLPNPGLRGVLKKYDGQWIKASQQIVPHLIAKSPAELEKMILMIEDGNVVAAVELGIAHTADVFYLKEMISAALGELAIIVRLPLNMAGQLAGAAYDAGASAVSIGPPRGALPDDDGNLIEGRLYGPGLFPQALAMVKMIAAMEIPVIGGVGVYEQEQIDLMMAAGAMGVQLDSVLWKGSR